MPDVTKTIVKLNTLKATFDRLLAKYAQLDISSGINVFLKRKDVALPVALTVDYANTGVVDTKLPSYDVYGTFPSGNGDGDYYLAYKDANNYCRFFFTGVNGTIIQVTSRVEGVNSVLADVRLPQLTVGDVLKFRVKVESTDTKVSIIVNNVLKATRSVPTIQGATKFTWRAYANPKPTDMYYAEVSDALVITSTELDTDKLPVLDIVYSNLVNEEAPSGYLLYVDKANGESVLGPVDTTILANDTPGISRIKSKLPLPISEKGTSPIVRLVQKNKTSVKNTNYISYPIEFLAGSNRVFGLAVYTELMNAGFQFQDMGHNYDYLTRAHPYISDTTGGIFNAPAGTGFRQNIYSRPEALDAIHVLKWTEGDNTSGTSKWTHSTLNENGTYFYSLTPIQHEGGNKYTRTLKYTTDFQKPGFGVLNWQGSGTAENFSLAEVGADLTKRYRTSYINLLKTLPGPMRELETGGFNIWQQNYTWADRPTRAGLNGSPGLPVEDYIECMNLTNRPLWIPVPLRWPEETIRKFFRAILTGEGTDNGIAANRNQKIVVETVGNEPWNPGLTQLYQALASDGAEAGLTTGEASRSLTMRGRRHNYVTDILINELPEFRSRLIFTKGLHPNNDAFEWSILKGEGIRNVDAVCKAMYLGQVVNEVIGNNTPEELYPRWKEAADECVDWYLRTRPTYQKDGVRLLCYEIGLDLTGNFMVDPDPGDPYRVFVLTPEQRETWTNSPLCKKLYKDMLTKVAMQSGDYMCEYWDIGSYRVGGYGSWGHYQGPGVANTKHDVFLEVQQAVNPQ